MENQEEKKVELVKITGSYEKKTPGSKQVDKVEFDHAEGKITIHFRTGAVYDYFNVPWSVAEAVYNSPSFGAVPRKELKDFKGHKREEIKD